MRLSRLYTNQPDVFDAISFNPGLSVILAEIRLPENREKDTHNLGKTTVAQLLDFCLLRGNSASFFLRKHEDLFLDFSFFLELELAPSSFVTILRAASASSKVSFKRHTAPLPATPEFAAADWDHFAVPFERAKRLLDGMLDFRALKPWDYRKEVGYLLRTQADFLDVFQLAKHVGRHADWKPVLAQILGFDAMPVGALYEKRGEREIVEDRVRLLEADLGKQDLDASTVEGLLALKQQEVDRRVSALDNFVLTRADASAEADVLDVIDEKLAILNEERYALGARLKRVTAALTEQQLLFDVKDAQDLFREAGVLFEGQLVRDFDQLIAFNRAITQERREGLSAEREDVSLRLQQVNSEIPTWEQQRAERLAFISDASAVDKYKELSADLVDLRADVETLSRQRDGVTQLQDLRTRARTLAEECGRLQTEIEANVLTVNRDPRSRFSQIRLYFNEIVVEVIDAKALLTVQPNREGNLEFRAEIVDASGGSTSRDRGSSYKKLLCVAFDLAVLRSYLDESFPRFVFHDGVFESLDDRKKFKLLGVLRQYAGLGLQPIVTAIDSDLPEPLQPQGGSFLSAGDVILTLHDEGTSGRLFRMDSW